MKVFARDVGSLKQKCLDTILAVASYPCAKLLLKYRNIGSKQLPRTTSTLRKVGLFPVRNHYYEPLFEDSLLTRPLSEDRDLPGIDLNESGQLKLLEEFNHSSELVAMHLNERSEDLGRFFINKRKF